MSNHIKTITIIILSIALWVSVFWIPAGLFYGLFKTLISGGIKIP